MHHVILSYRRPQGACLGTGFLCLLARCRCRLTTAGLSSSATRVSAPRPKLVGAPCSLSGHQLSLPDSPRFTLDTTVGQGSMLIHWVSHLLLSSRRFTMVGTQTQLSVFICDILVKRLYWMNELTKFSCCTKWNRCILSWSYEGP